MREVEVDLGGAPELVGQTMSKSVTKRLEIQEAIPKRAPEDVRRNMTKRMVRWKKEVERLVEGETSADKDLRLKRLWAEMYPEEPRACACGGSGLIERDGTYEARSGRKTAGTYMAICDCRFGDERRAHARGEIYGMEDSKDGPF